MKDIISKILNKGLPIFERDYIYLIEGLEREFGVEVFPELLFYSFYTSITDFEKKGKKIMMKRYDINYIKDLIEKKDLQSIFDNIILSNEELFKDINIRDIYFHFLRPSEKKNNETFREYIEIYEKKLESIVVKHIALRYYPYMKNIPILLKKRRLADELDILHNSPELIITILTTILSTGIIGIILKKYLPEKENVPKLLYKAKLKLLLTLKRFRLFLSRRSPTAIWRYQIEYLKREISRLAQEKGFYQTDSKDIMNEIQLLSAQEIINEIDKKLQILNKMLLKAKFRHSVSKKERPKNYKDLKIQAKVEYDTNVLFPQIKEKLGEVSKLLEIYESAL